MNIKPFFPFSSDAALITPEIYTDARGYFFELYNEKYEQYGIGPFVQDNVSLSHKNVIRGLHLQNPHQQGKLISVLQGEIIDVFVDVRKLSKTFGKHEKVNLNDKNKHQLYVPPGFAHGFKVVSDTAIVLYKCTSLRNQNSEISILWNDPMLKIDWGCESPILSEKDANAKTLFEVYNKLPT